MHPEALGNLKDRDVEFLEFDFLLQLLTKQIWKLQTSLKDRRKFLPQFMRSPDSWPHTFLIFFLRVGLSQQKCGGRMCPSFSFICTSLQMVVDTDQQSIQSPGRVLHNEKMTFPFFYLPRVRTNCFCHNGQEKSTSILELLSERVGRSRFSDFICCMWVKMKTAGFWRKQIQQGLLKGGATLACLTIPGANNEPGCSPWGSFPVF